MLKENTLDNWILGGTVFLMIFAFGCYLWFQNEMAYLQPEDDDQNVEIQQLDESSKQEQIETHQTERDDTEQVDSFKNISHDDYADITSEVNSTHQKNLKKSGENRRSNIAFQLLPTAKIMVFSTSL